MKKPELFKEYIWLVNIIKHYRKISLQEINTLWLETEMSEGIPFARSTFNRHKDAIEDMFGIIIDCDRRDGYRYYIANEEVLGQHTVQNWMLSTLTVSNVIAAGMSLRGRILLESIPVQGKKLAVAIHAMRAGCCLMIDYRKYGSKQSRQFVVEPYCLKYFRQRWYILARYKKNGYYAMLSLDRIEDMLVSDVRFKLDPGFDAEEFFSAYYGVLSTTRLRSLPSPCAPTVLRPTTCATCPCTSRSGSWLMATVGPTINCSFDPRPTSLPRSCREAPGSRCSRHSG